MTSVIVTKVREKPGQRLSTEHIASFVGMVFRRATTMESTMNLPGNSRFWFVDLSVFTDDDFAPSMTTDRPETVQLEEPSA
jgi:hypothetical protein